MQSPKPGDPDFKPRYQSADLDAIRERIRQRRMAAVAHNRRDVLDGDTDIMEALVGEVASLRIALEVEKEWRTKGTTT